MILKRLLWTSACCLFLVTSAWGGVEVKNKSQVKLGGAMGKVFGMFGGKAARDGIVTTSVVVGNRKLTRTEDTGQIIDLDEEKVYEVNWKKKSYRVMTFEEMRQQMEEAARKLEEQAGQANPEAADDQERQYEVDFELKESGQTRNINGYDCGEVVMTITIREKGKTLEDGGSVMTTHLWLSDDLEGLGEIEEFDRRFAEKMATTLLDSDQQMAMMGAMYPAIKEAFARFEVEKVNVQGSPVLSVITMESVAPKGQAVESSREESPGLGGMLGGLGRRLGRKKADEEPAAQSAPGRSLLMTINQEVVSVNPGAGPEAVALPAGFKQQK